MQDLLLIAAIAGVFVFVGYLMGKVDAVLDGSRQDSSAPLSVRDTLLRIGFYDPLAADSLSGLLEKYSENHPNVSVSLFSGTEAELIKAFCYHKIDLIFLPENAFIPEKLHARVDEVSLAHTPVEMHYGGLPIEPITEGQVRQQVIWQDGDRASEAERLIRYLKNETPALHAGAAK